MESTALQKKADKPMAVLIKDQAIVAKFANVIQGGTASEKASKANAFLGSVLSLTQSNTSFKDVQPMSVLASAMVAAQCDLPIIPTLGMAAVIPYKVKDGEGKAQFQIMVNGLVQLFFRSGQAKALNAFTVYTDEYDGFDKIKGELKPLKPHDDKCQDVAGYGCYMALVNGFEKTIFWSLGKMTDHAKRYSQAYSYDVKYNKKSSPWSTNFEAMAHKTIIKYMINHFAPKSVQLQTALDADQAITDFDSDGVVELNYDDNNDVEVQFSAEEIAEREALLAKLESISIKREMIYPTVKGAKSIDDVPTQHLRDLVAQEF